MAGDDAKQSQSPTDLEQEAARWVVRMHSDQVTIEDERAFARWIVESAAHRKEYDSQAATWASLGALSKDDEALKALSDLRAPVGRSLERRSMLAAAFAGALFLVAGGAAAWHSITSNQRYSTGLGEQQNIVLADGSQVTLNTDTTLRVELDGGERRVWLDHGQAFFTVAHDRKRPFRVFAGGGEARAIGTAFDVRQDDTLTKVTLTEGSLAVFASAERVRGARPTRC
ncbi:MAG: FecR domain-containing protein [Alphaproteobacteria bacterium]